VDDKEVRFSFRDRADGDRKKIACLPAEEFIRRFLCHVLPKGFTRIRHYGLLAGRNKNDLLPRCRQCLGAAEPEPPKEKTTAEWLLLLTGIDVTRCPQCGHQPLQRSELPPQRRPRHTRLPCTLKPLDDTS